MSLNRRTLLRRSVLGAVAFSASSYQRILGANDKIGLGLIGCGGRGRSVLGNFGANSSISINALCDVYPARIDEAARYVSLDALALSVRYGLPIDAVAERLEGELAERRRRVLETRIRQLPVRLLFPLVLCVLPAFVLVGVVPVVVAAWT